MRNSLHFGLFYTLGVINYNTNSSFNQRLNEFVSSIIISESNIFVNSTNVNAFVVKNNFTVKDFFCTIVNHHHDAITQLGGSPGNHASTFFYFYG